MISFEPSWVDILFFLYLAWIFQCVYCMLTKCSISHINIFLKLTFWYNFDTHNSAHIHCRKCAPVHNICWFLFFLILIILISFFFHYSHHLSLHLLCVWMWKHLTLGTDIFCILWYCKTGDNINVSTGDEEHQYGILIQ